MLIISSIVLITIFILNIVLGMYFKFGFRHYWFFETLHFLGGFFVAMLFYNFSQSPTAILTGLAVVVFLWELAEYLLAEIPGLARRVKKISGQRNIKPKWKDTLLDIFLDFAGAAVFIYFFI